MSSFLNNLSNKLNSLLIETIDTSWKDPNSPHYDRQEAENALYNTIGPLTDNPRWMPEWDGHSDPVPGFVPGGPAPRWTENEVIVACAGDPKYMNLEGHPKSPRYGDRGGAPLFRMARSVAKQYGRNSWDFIQEVYSNGLVGLARYVKPGYDEARSPFIRWLFGTGRSGGKVLPFIRSTMEAGIGSSQRARNAIGAINALMTAKTSAQAQQVADKIGPKYRTQRSYDKTDENAFDQLSPTIYKAAMDTINALQSGNQEIVDNNKKNLEQVKTQIEDELEMIPGAATGIDRAITNKDRDTSKLGIVSADAERGTDSEGATIGSTLAGSAEEESEDMASAESDREVIYKILDYAMQFKFKDILQKGSKYFEGQEPPSGSLTINELRYIIRSNGIIYYPGKGNPRKNTSLPRDQGSWCSYGEDPELEPIPGSDEVWKSIWVRNGYQAVGPTEIAAEMTEEVHEFQRLGIPTARTVKAKAGGKSEALSKVAVGRTLNSALQKLHIAGRLVKDEMGELDESVKDALRNNGMVLYEDMNQIDRKIFDSGYRRLMRMFSRFIAESL